ncbi:hypothetical protein, partial [Pseudomonas sp. FW305-117]
QQLQPLALAISRKREANSTGIAMNVNPLILKKAKHLLAYKNQGAPPHLLSHRIFYIEGAHNLGT